MPTPLSRRDQREPTHLAIRRPHPRVLLELGTAMWDLMHAFDRVFRSLGIPTAMSFVEEEELRVESVEIACPSCEEVTIIDQRLAEATKFCSRCGSLLEDEDAEKAE